MFVFFGNDLPSLTTEAKDLFIHHLAKPQYPAYVN